MQKKNINYNWLLILGLGLLFLGIYFENTVNVQAAQYTVVAEKKCHTKPYHLKLPIDEKVAVWNRRHDAQVVSYTDLINNREITWYVTKNVTMKHNNKRSKYFQVHSNDDRYKGYIWHGYLKKGKTKILSPNLPPNLYDPLSQDSTAFSVNSLSRDEIDNKLNKKVADLFPGTIRDNQVQLATDFCDHRILGKNNLDKITEIVTKNKYNGSKSGLIKFVKQQISAQLAKQDKKLTDFKGYRIGATTYPLNDGYRKDYYGRTCIYLVPDQVVLPKLKAVTFDPVSDNNLALSWAQVDEQLNDEVAKLFPNTIRDKQVDAAAQLYYADIVYQEDDSEDYYGQVNSVKHLLGKNNYLKRITELNIHTLGKGSDLTTSQKFNLIKKYLVDSGTKFDSFAGYRIGVYVAPFVPATRYAEDSRNNGMTEILLVPPTVNLPQIGNYSFDINKQDILN